MLNEARRLLMLDRDTHGAAKAVPGGIEFYKGEKIVVSWQIEAGPTLNHRTIKRFQNDGDRIRGIWPSDTFHFNLRDAAELMFDMAVVATSIFPTPPIV